MRASSTAESMPASPPMPPLTPPELELTAEMPAASPPSACAGYYMDMGGRAAIGADRISSGAGGQNPAADLTLTVTQKVERIKEQLGLEAALPISTAVAAALESLGMPRGGTLVTQIDAINSQLGLGVMRGCGPLDTATPAEVDGELLEEGEGG